MNATRIRSLLTLAIVPVAVLTATPAQATEPYCGITWGSRAEAGGSSTADVGALTELRAGRHACFDRLVVDLGHGADADVQWRVGYVPTVREVGTGDPLPLRGAADLEIVVTAHGHDGQGNATFDPPVDAAAEDVAGFTTFRQVSWGHSFEAQSVIGLGVRARLPFRVHTLEGGGPGDSARLVIDVAHRW
ncbi:hypothetical protein OF117_09140 [Geodermatophilus sp. YIM 151500]|uniref:AMIN-like domain-containing (lipo)protein n=1 Tax=Geodermatophilus sp. YIM 151500 TaxID=2984531 RepID=UPI0021E4CA69|nr:hypothetical protein [Geodermatophilus sp. YIM 151500]MCV2489533.1 hypothetical protein [Geodermatophilus sp. YIM 151500]